MDERFISQMERIVTQLNGGSVISSGEDAAILLIDDNAVQAATRQAILKKVGYYVIAVLNPMRALEQFKNDDFPVKIRLVITDHVMPGMTGAEFVRALRETHNELPVLVISGLDEAKDDYEGLNVLFRLKPLPPDQLMESVERMIAGEMPED